MPFRHTLENPLLIMTAGPSAGLDIAGASSVLMICVTAQFLKYPV